MPFKPFGVIAGRQTGHEPPEGRVYLPARI